MNHDMAIRLRDDRIAAHPALKGLLPRWRKELVGQVVGACKHFTLPRIVDSIADKIIGNFCAEHAISGLDLTATDSEIVETAKRRADKSAMSICTAKNPDAVEAIISSTCRMANVPEPKGETLQARIKRFSCPHWWRRKLRTNHARAIENGNIKLHFVQAKREPYASRDALIRCVRQDERNLRWMEKTMLQNEFGDRFSMQELSEKGTSNKAIRRAELMTRIRGMEDYAVKHGYIALFITVTCPSHFHSTLRASGEANPLYSGRTPRQAQEYLCKIWSQARAQFMRDGIAPFGLRVAEPHHDACPHWHMILFVKPEQVTLLASTIRHYALLDSPDEKGAQEYRCKFVEIAAEQGSATGYIAKYIAKNIDGYKLETDLTGEPALKASLHVAAWAKTHGIRQFQGIGEPPVTVWREMRRIPADVIQGAPEHVKAAWLASQKLVDTDGATGQRADYAAFIEAMGGAAIPRKHARIRLAKLHSDELGRYGEMRGEQPIGLYSYDAPLKVYVSTRYKWVRVDGMGQAIATNGESQARALLQKTGSASPWTRVNNCTHPKAEISPSAKFHAANTASIFGRMRC